MKKSVFLILAILISIPVFSQDIFKQLTDKYSGQDGFSATKITNDMFDLYLRKKNIDKDSPIYETLKDLDNILVVSQSKFGSEKELDLSEIHNEILSLYADYTLLKTEKKMGEDIKVYLDKSNGIVKSLVLITASKTSVNLVEMNGAIDMSSLSELNKALNIRGLENLYKINGGSSFQFYGGTFTAPELYFNGDFNSEDFFNEDRIKELQERIKEQSFLSEDQYLQQAQEMAKKQAQMAEKYREMADKYDRKPIFLSYPGDSTTAYYINGEKVDAEDIKKLDKEKILTIDISKNEENDRNEIRITTKK